MKEVYCDVHGKQNRSAIICRHLCESLHTKKVVGFSIPWEEIPEDESLEAWCNECMIILDRERGWNDVSEEFADFKFVCEKCYQNARKINS